MFGLDTAILVSLLTFIGGYFITEYRKRRDQRIARRKYLLALYTEIELNTVSLDQAIRGIPSTKDIREFLQSGPQPPANPAGPGSGPAPPVPQMPRPHLINAHLDYIFKQNIGILADMPDGLIRSVIDFYGKLDWIDVIIDSIERQSFGSISMPGREAVLERARIALHEARQQGTEILGSIRLILNPQRSI